MRLKGLRVLNRLALESICPSINLETSLGITHATNLARQLLAPNYVSQFYSWLLIVDMYNMLNNQQQRLYINFIVVSLMIEFTHIIPCYFTHTGIIIKAYHYILLLGI